VGAERAAVRLWWPSELRRRWPGLVVLGLLAGVTAGLAVAALDGAGRTDSAYDRLRSEHVAADAVFFPSQVGVYDADVTRLEELPEVEAWAGFASTWSVIDEAPGGDPLVPVGSGWFSTIERATVLEGRLPDPTSDDEAVLTANIGRDAEELGIGVGSLLTWRTLSPADVATLGDEPPPDFDWTTATGPVTKLRIVGVVRLPMESVLSFASSGLLLPGPGWAEAHLATDGTPITGTAARGWVNALVRLRDGAADVPDTVRVGPSARVMEVVGISLLAQTPHTSFDEGGWLTPNGLDSVTGTVCCSREREDIALVRLRQGADTEAVVADLSTNGLWITPPDTPPDVTNLRNVRRLPLFLAGFLVVLALGAVAHALLTGARSRSHDLAVLRALGLTPGQAASCVTWQAATIGAVALLVGIPLGVVLGRQVWRLLADSLSFVYVGPVAGVVLLVLIPVALVVLGVMAIWPARDAARLHITDLLRAE
jgi:hypothetical protein